MINITNDLKAKLLTAQSAEEVAALVKAAGQEIGPEETERLWAEIRKGKEQDGKVLSLDELEAVSGGGRNALTEGCSSTVGINDSCVFTDSCSFAWVHYDVEPYNITCPNDGYYPLYGDRPHKWFFCPKCGSKFADDGKLTPIGFAEAEPINWSLH